MAGSRDIETQVHHLREAIERLVLRSRRYAGLRRLLRDGGYELQIMLTPLEGGPEAGARAPRLALTAADRRFLKQAGIKC